MSDTRDLFRQPASREQRLLTIVSTNGLQLKHIASEDISYLLCIAAVNQNSMALQYVPMVMRDYKLCGLAIERNWLAIEFIPPEVMDDQLCKDALAQNVCAICLIPSPLRSKEICLLAVNANGMLLEYVPHRYHDKEMCILAVNNEALALQYVDEYLKQDVIEEIGLINIISRNFQCVNYLPGDSPDYSKQIDPFIAKVQYIIVCEENENLNDKEIKDTFLAYSHSYKRYGKTIFTSNNYLELLLNVIAQAKMSTENSDSLTLVLLGHAYPSASELAGFTPEHIASIIQNFAFITKVTLLGCKTAQSLMLEEEKDLIDKFLQQSIHLPKQFSQYGIFYSNSPVDQEHEQPLLTLASKKNFQYLLVVSLCKEHLSQCTIQLAQIQKAEGITIIDSFITDLKAIQQALPKAKGLYLSQDHSAKSDAIVIPRSFALKTTEVLALMTLKLEQVLAEDIAADFRAKKQIIPFLRNFKLSPALAQEKLQDSLLLKLFSLVNSPGGAPKQSIKLKGFTDVVHVDTKDGRLISSDSHIYSDDYGLGSQIFWPKRAASINRDYLYQVRMQQIQHYVKHQTTDTTRTVTSAKSLTIKLPAAR
jgi:hypothetical protein